MDSSNLEVLKTAHIWLQEQYPVVLVTLIRTVGSAPRPVGSLLAIRQDGRFVGSLSGGCIETDLLEQVRKQFPSTPAILEYGVSTAQARQFGLPCGGRMTLVLEPLHAPDSLQSVLSMLRQGQCVVRTLEVHTGRVSLESYVAQTTCEAEYSGLLHYSEGRVSMRFGPRWRLLIIGAGEITRYLVALAKSLDYELAVCDPRAEYQQSWMVEGIQLSTDMPDDFVIQNRPDAHTAIVAVAHDLKQDDLALLEALKSEAFYVGAIGSKQTQAKRRERLALFDLTSAQIGRLRGPVGLPIGSRTPPEIAIAIVAELIAVRQGRRLCERPT